MQKQFERTQVGWNFWLWWVLASTVVVGVVVAVVVGIALADPLDAASAGSGLAGFVFLVTLVVGLVLIGPVVGFSQCLILRRWVPQAGWWIVASSVAVPVAVVVGWVVGDYLVVGESMSLGRIVRWYVAQFLVSPAVTGAVVGFSQWLILRRWVPQAGWWIVASSVAVVVGWDVTMGLDVGRVLGGFAFGFLYGTITGGALVWLLRQPRPEPVQTVKP